MSKKRDSEKMIQRILDASFELFRTKGYEHTTILDIVEFMNVSRGAFYHHFKSKEEVLNAILEQRANIEWHSEVYNDSNLSGLEKLRMLMFFDNAERKMAQEDTQLMYMSLNLLKNPHVMAEHIKESQGDGKPAVGVRMLVEEAIADGSMANQNSEILTELLLLLLGFWVIPTIYIPATLESFQDKILLIKAILDGLGCPLIDDEVIQMYQDIAESYEEEEEKYEIE